MAGLGVLALAAVLASLLVAVSRQHSGLGPEKLDSSSVPLFGSSVTGADLSQTTAQFGRMPIDRVYYPGLPASNAWTGGLASANDSAVIVSFKALPADILSGADDAALSHFFDTAPAGHPIYYSYYHEPEDNIADGQFTLGDYKAAWARVVQLADAARNPDLHSTLILMEWDLQKASGRNWKDYLPGGGIISTLGWDAYSQGSATNVNPQPTPPADFMGPAIAASKSVGLPYGFAEFGLSTATGRSAWMTEVGNYLLASGALFATVFNGSPQYPTLQLTDQTSQDVWRGFVTKSEAANAGSSPAQPAPTASTTATASAAPGTPAPGTPAPSSPAPAASASWVTGLSVSPAQFAVNGSDRTVIGFQVGQASDVTVLVLKADGTVVREIAKPGRSAGPVAVPYYGYGGSSHRLPPGTYQVLIVASNALGSATAETTLTIT
jgi:hypothetical protein